jgi:hypothetical protein
MDALSIVSGNNQIADAGDALTNPLIVEVDVTEDTPHVTEVVFTFVSVPLNASGQAISPWVYPLAVDDTAAQASVAVTLGDTAGTYSIQADLVVDGVTVDSVAFNAMTTPATASTDICTLAEVKLYMNKTDSDDDTALSAWITAETSEIESFLGQPVVPRLVTDYLDGDGSSLIETLSGRVSSIYTTPDVMSNVQYGEMDAGSWDWTDIATTADEIVVDQTNPWVIELLDGLTFPRGRKNIKVTYYAGFATIPGEIKSVCIERVVMHFNDSKRSDSPRLGMSTANRGGGGQSLGDSFVNMEPRWAERLNKHRTFV